MESQRVDKIWVYYKTASTALWA